MAQYELRYKKTVAKVKSLGGEFCSFVPENGKEYIWQGDPSVWVGHSPILFPVVGSTVDNTVKIGSVPYPQKKHGSIRKREWKVGKRGEDFIEMVFESDEETKKEFPFDYAAHIVHTISENSFSTNFVIENKTDQVMPVCIGGHPGFNIPLYEGEAYTDYALKFECVEDGKNSLAPNGYIITGTEYIDGFKNSDTLPLNHGLFDDRDALIFADIRSRSVKVVNKAGKGIRFDYPKFDALGVWSAPGKNANYVCLEPWCGLPAIEGESGNMEDKPYVKFIKPHESFKVGYTMTILD